MDDERGWRPKNQPILSDNSDISFSYKCQLDLEALCEELAKQWKVGVSEDPGRFVCNWTYFNSLALAMEKVPAQPIVLFCHVPPLDVYSLEKLEHFALQLLSAIYKQVSDR